MSTFQFRKNCSFQYAQCGSTCKKKKKKHSPCTVKGFPRLQHICDACICYVVVSCTSVVVPRYRVPRKQIRNKAHMNSGTDCSLLRSEAGTRLLLILMPATLLQSQLAFSINSAHSADRTLHWALCALCLSAVYPVTDASLPSDRLVNQLAHFSFHSLRAGPN